MDAQKAIDSGSVCNDLYCLPLNEVEYCFLILNMLKLSLSLFLSYYLLGGGGREGEGSVEE